MTVRLVAITVIAFICVSLLAAHQLQTPCAATADELLSECADEACVAAMLDLAPGGGLNLLQKKAEVKKSMQVASSGAAATQQQLALLYASHSGHYAQLLDTSRPAGTCSNKHSNPANFVVSMTIPSIMVVLFASATVFLTYAYPRPPANEVATGRVTHVDENGMPLAINWHFVIWSGCAIGMANVNYVVVLPIAVENFSGSMWEAGLWVGLYAVGALISFPIFIALGWKRTRAALAVHGFTTLVGNLIMVYGAIVQSIPCLMVGRITTGLAFGIYYTCNQGCLYLIPTWDRLDAIFISRCVYSIGFAMGPCISPICNFVLTRTPWMMDIFHHYNASSEGTPLLLMSLYGFCFMMGSIFVFKECVILDAETEGVSIGASATDPNQCNATYQEKKEAAIIFASVTTTNFTRNFIRVLWETGTVMILAKIYCVATGAGICVSIVAITLVVSRGAIGKLGLACKGDNAKLMRILEWGGALSCPFMFTYGLPTGELTLCCFLIGGIIFYNANAAQSGVLLAVGGEAAIAGHGWLDKTALNNYMYCSMLMAYCCGPICTFISQEFNPGQTTVAGLVTIVTVLQIVVTYASVKSKNKQAEDSPEGGKKPALASAQK